MDRILDAVSGPVVHPELLHGHAEGDKVEQSRDPAIEGVLHVAGVQIALQFVHVFVRLLERDVLDEGHRVGPEENAHKGELHDAPNAEDDPAQGQFGPAQSHDEDRDMED